MSESFSTAAGDNSAATETPKATTGNDTFLVVGERAFKDQESVVMHIDSAQTHIKTLESENAGFKEKQQAMLDRMQELEDKLAESSKIDEVLKQVSENGNPTKVTEPTAPTSNSLSAEDINNAVDARLTAMERQRAQKANVDVCLAKAKEAFGDSMDSEIAKAAEALDMTVAEAAKLAGERPVAFMKLYLPKVDSSFATPTVGDRSTRSVTDNAPPAEMPKSVMGASTTARDGALWAACHPDKYKQT